MDILIGTSLITAFVAGVAALFAPCCVTVLLPAYLASIFKQKRTVFLMTFVFFVGVLTVFLPLGLGIAAVGQFFRQYHDQLYTVGGLFLVVLGISILIGRHISLPFSARSKIAGLKVESAGSIYVLGIFSGFATLCCAPVLAGVMALSALPGSLFWGGVYSLIYAMGMVMPLFVIAYFLDKTNFTGKFSGFKKHINYSLLGKEIDVTISELIAGSMYLLIGILTLYLDWTNKLAMGGGYYQMAINIYLARFTQYLNQLLSKIPWVVWPLAILVALVFIVRVVVKMIKKDNGLNSPGK